MVNTTSKTSVKPSSTMKTKTLSPTNSLLNSPLLTSKLYLVVFATYVICQLGYWLNDSALALSPVGRPDAVVAAGGSRVLVVVPVDFSKRRNCDMLMSRYFLDSSGTYFDIMATRYISQHGLEEMVRASPRDLRFVVQLPSESAISNGDIVTQISSMCNPLQGVWPVSVDIRTPVRISSSPK